MKPSTDEVLAWAREAGMYDGVSDLCYPLSMFESFAALAYAAGAAAMKERAEKVCREFETGWREEYEINRDPYFNFGSDAAAKCARAIRALGDNDE